MKAKYCPNCRVERLPNYTYCQKCGTKLIEGSPLRCPKCNKSMLKNHVFCPYCGERSKR